MPTMEEELRAICPDLFKNQVNLMNIQISEFEGMQCDGYLMPSDNFMLTFTYNLSFTENIDSVDLMEWVFRLHDAPSAELDAPLAISIAYFLRKALYYAYNEKPESYIIDNIECVRKLLSYAKRHEGSLGYNFRNMIGWCMCACAHAFESRSGNRTAYLVASYRAKPRFVREKAYSWCRPYGTRIYEIMSR